MSPPAHLYHVTFLHSLDSIASRGLRPGAGQTFGGGYAGHSRGRVFLTEWDGVSFWMSKYEDMAHHHTDNPEEGWVPVCLKVSTRGLDLEPDPAGSRDAYADSYFTTESISPRQIQVWHGGWKAVGSVDTEEMQDEVMEAAEKDADETGTWYEVDFEMFEPARKAASRLPGWLQRGKPVPDVSRRSRDADFILEGDEWDWEWREVEIPFSLFGREFKRLTGWGAKDEDGRDESIRTWMQRSGGPRKALQQSPILAMWDGGNLELLDGAHRIRIAQELGEDKGTVLVGIEPAGNRRLASSYAPAADRRGEPLAPGDYVSFRTYPRGTKKGWVTISQKWMSEWRDEEGQRHTSPALAIVTEDGTVYDLSPKGTTKLRKQVPPPVSIRTADTLEAPPTPGARMATDSKDKTNYVPMQDRLGKPLYPGDFVRIKLFACNPVEGWVTVSQSYVSDCFEDDGERIWAPRLEVVTKDNTPYKLISNRTTKLSPQVPPPSTVTIHKQATAVLLPLMSPRYNLREMMKQIALLEDHLAHPEKQCDDCIQKHFLTIEALAEEAATLDTAGQFPGLAQIPIEIRKLEGRWIDGDTRRALEWLRSFRKLVTPMVFDIRKASMTTATLIGCVTNGNRLVGCSDRLDTACDPQNWPQYGRQLFDLWLYRDVPIDLAEKLVDHGYGYFHQGGFQFQTDHDAWKAAEPYAALDEPLIPMGTELTEEFLALVQQAVQNPARLASVSSLLDAQNRTIERIGAMRNRTARSEEYYLGDDDAGVYWTVDERGDAYYLNAWVDAEHFTEDLIKNDGPYESEYAAAESGHGAAVEWCLDNDVPLSRREMVFEGWLKANRRVFSTPRRASAHRIAEHWIQDAIKRPGRVREYLGIPKGETIPMADLESAIDRLKMKARRTPEETSLLRALYLARTLKTRFH